ncbi:MAG: hypothetical protein NZ519_13885 [Bacteroidia bacterium]|nr:hypothetical protein [Bacteroidia bacterium]MDW8348525.1 hypothetical protein [Bacteroidia bacterium]
MITIANPAYNVVFKYLMEDTNVAKLLLSDLMQEEIIEIVIRPQEHIFDIMTVMVFRMDFEVKIKTAKGREKTMLAKVQKSKSPKEILPLRPRPVKNQGMRKKIARTEKSEFELLPFIMIHFVSYDVEETPTCPILHLRRKIIDVITKEEIDVEDEFIDLITHDSVIVQIPMLKKVRRNELELILSLFDETEFLQEITINEEDYPVKYREVIQRLSEAASSENIRRSMNIEDSIAEIFKLTEERKQKLEQELKQEKHRSEYMEQEKVKLIQFMLNNGITLQQIQQNLSIDKAFMKKHKLL